MIFITILLPILVANAKAFNTQIELFHLDKTWFIYREKKIFSQPDGGSEVLNNKKNFIQLKMSRQTYQFHHTSFPKHFRTSIVPMKSNDPGPKLLVRVNVMISKEKFGKLSHNFFNENFKQRFRRYDCSTVDFCCFQFK